MSGGDRLWRARRRRAPCSAPAEPALRKRSLERNRVLARLAETERPAGGAVRAVSGDAGVGLDAPPTDPTHTRPSSTSRTPTRTACGSRRRPRPRGRLGARPVGFASSWRSAAPRSRAQSGCGRGMRSAPRGDSTTESIGTGCSRSARAASRPPQGLSRGKSALRSRRHRSARASAIHGAVRHRLVEALANAQQPRCLLPAAAGSRSWSCDPGSPSGSESSFRGSCRSSEEAEP